MLILCLLFVTRLDKIYKLYHDVSCVVKYGYNTDVGISDLVMAVKNQWNGMVEWNTGMG